MSTYTREALLAKYAEMTALLGRAPKRREFRTLGGVSENPFYRVFGSITAITDQPSTGAVPEVAPCTKTDTLLEALRSNLTEEELRVLVKATGVTSSKPLLTHTGLETGHVKFLVVSDTHMGHSKFRSDWWYRMIEHAAKEKVDFAYHAGDILEGMSGRPGHVYELSEIGFEAQFAKAKALIGDCPFQVRGIIGNHDGWFCGKADQGVNVGQRLEESLSNFVYLGAEEADQTVENIRIKLWHGNDGASYAISYRGQKFVEQLDGGDKPHILITGHDHKSIFFQTRNVHVIGAGTLCEQTSFMRGRKLAAHRGYWIVECWSNEHGLARIRPEWNPFY